MGIPKSVKDQGDKAEKMQKDLIEGKTGEPDPTPAPDPEKQDDVKEVQEKEVKPEEKPVEPKKEAEPKPAGDEWEHKYKVLKGKFDAEVPRLNTKLTEVTTLLAQANTRIGDLEQRLAERPQADPKESEPKAATVGELDPAKIFSAQELEELEQAGFDSDALKVMAKIHAKLVGSRSGDGDTKEVKAIKGEVETLKKRQQESDQETFYSRLEKLVPDWKKVNGWKPEGIEQDPQWSEWLSEIDPASGLPRQDLLTIAAQKDRDVRRVAWFFDEFKKIHPDRYGLGAPSEPVKEPEPDPLEKEVVPEGGKPPGGPEPKVETISGEEYLKAAADRAKGKIGEGEFEKIHTKFLAAQGIK